MILVTGATGHLGGQTIDFLLKKNVRKPIAALVRDLTKAEDLKAKGIALRKGDYSDYPSLVEAFKGVEILLLVSSGTLENRFQQHVNAIDAAKANGVKHIIYTSVVRANPNTKFLPGIDHYQTEEYLKKSGVSFTVFRNTFYVEALLLFLGEAMATGNWFYAAGQAKANFALRTDMAEALANVLISPSEHQDKLYEITSGKSYSFNEIADILSKTSGKEIKYIPIPLEALKEGMKKAGVPEMYIPMLASIAEAISESEVDFTDSALEKLLQRKPEDLSVALPKVLAQPVQVA